MALCKNCIYGERIRVIDDNENLIDIYYWCNIYGEYISIEQAEDDTGCEAYDEELDDNETEESSA